MRTCLVISVVIHVAFVLWLVLGPGAKAFDPANAEPILVDRATGRAIKEPDYALAAGPAATEGVRQRYASTARPALRNGKGRPRKERAR